MLDDKNKYFGLKECSTRTELFNVSITKHSIDEEIPYHSHAKPYLCLLVSGAYQEKSTSVSLIQSGHVLYRGANYEHSNSFLSQEGICLNIEINDFEFLSDLSDIKLPEQLEQRISSIETYKVLQAMHGSSEVDTLNILCYEAMISQLNMRQQKGKIEWINQVIERINDCPMEPFSLTQLSQDIGLHTNYIVRKFKEKTGYTLSEYIVRSRLSYAINHALNTNENLTETAVLSGFYDQSHFNRNFKKQFNTTPRQFIKSIQG